LRLICFHLLWPAMAELLEADEVWAAGRPVRGGPVAPAET
jgi:hypothetical protein